MDDAKKAKNDEFYTLYEDIQKEMTLSFMDAAKGQYLRFLPDVLRLLNSGGILVSDNVLQEGEVIESRFAVTRRNRTIHSRMREYLYELKHHEQLQTSILPLGDGVIDFKRFFEIFSKNN